MRIVGLSATLPNYKDVAKFLRVNATSGSTMVIMMIVMIIARMMVIDNNNDDNDNDGRRC